MNLINCKVFWNKKNGQGKIQLPKKAFAIKPDEIALQIPKKFANEQFFFREKLKGGNTLRK